MSQETAATTAPAVPVQRVDEPEPAQAPPQAAAPARSAPPVSFDRLLAVATLTPGQALLVAARLLRAGAARGATAATSTAGCRLGPVSLTPSGDVEVAVASAEEETPVTELLQRLLQNARRLPAHPKPEQHQLLHRLEEATATPVPDPEDRADGLEEALAATLGSGARQRLSAQLAALVEAATHVVPRIPAPAEGGSPRAAVGSTTQETPTPDPVPAAPDRSRPVPHRAVPAAAGSSRAFRRRGHLSSRGRRRRLALIVAILVAALAASAYVGLLHRGAGIVESLGGGSQPTAPPTHPTVGPAHQPAQHPKVHRSRAVPTLAARHAGPVAGVLVQKSGSCGPGSLCPVKVTVHLRTASTGQPVRWKVGAARTCNRGMVWSPPTTVTPLPGWRTVYASSSVRVPRRSLALLALTTTPVRVQSPPVPVTGASPHC
jgi:hypothetical protein